MQERSGPSEPGVVRTVPFGQARRGRSAASPGGDRATRRRAPSASGSDGPSRPSISAGIEELFADLAALDTTPGGAPARGAEGPGRGDAARRASRGADVRPLDDERIDPEERAFLLQIYRELVGGAQGPVIPFPVELVAGEDEAPELDRPADVIDLDRYRARRALRET